MFEAVNSVYSILTPIAEANRDYKKLAYIHGWEIITVFIYMLNWCTRYLNTWIFFNIDYADALLDKFNKITHTQLGMLKGNWHVQVNFYYIVFWLQFKFNTWRCYWSQSPRRLVVRRSLFRLLAWNVTLARPLDGDPGCSVYIAPRQTFFVISCAP
jgi:hypothetical protein